MIRIMKYGELPDSEIFARVNAGGDVSAVVAEIIANVRARGDEALFAYCEKFDGAAPKPVEATAADMDAAMTLVSPELLRALEKAAENIRFFHEKQRRAGFELCKEDGVVLGQRVMPLALVGLYIPGGTASYPSTVLMNAIPAKIAGVPEVIMVTPAKDGLIRPEILAAAKIAGVDRVFKIGGAQAVAALAYGTESVPMADKIVGPGNAFVAEAKKQVFGQVAIDMIAGPSEILIISDGKTKPESIAADMLSQAEHDVNASAVLVTDSMALAESVAGQLETRLKALPREKFARASIENNGKIIIVDTLEKAAEISNALAPEHLELCVEEPFALLEKITNAGSVFLGRSCPEAVGDYFSGTNHTLPTMGTARFSSPLSVDDFIKRSTYTYYTPAALAKAAPYITAMAECEGLAAHARSVTVRTGE